MTSECNCNYIDCSETLPSGDWTVLEEYVSLIKPLFELIEEYILSYCISSIVIPLLRGWQRAI